MIVNSQFHIIVPDSIELKKAFCGDLVDARLKVLDTTNESIDCKIQWGQTGRLLEQLFSGPYGLNLSTNHQRSEKSFTKLKQPTSGCHLLGLHCLCIQPPSQDSFFSFVTLLPACHCQRLSKWRDVVLMFPPLVLKDK
jgi:hypothetical protein